MAEPEGSPVSLLWSRLPADLRWLDACEAAWAGPGVEG